MGEFPPFFLTLFHIYQVLHLLPFSVCVAILGMLDTQ